MGAEGQDWIRGGTENAARQVVLGGGVGGSGQAGLVLLHPFLLGVPEESTSPCLSFPPWG